MPLRLIFAAVGLLSLGYLAGSNIPPADWPTSIERGRVLVLSEDVQPEQITWAISPFTPNWEAALNGKPALIVETLGAPAEIVIARAVVIDGKLDLKQRAISVTGAPGPSHPVTVNPYPAPTTVYLELVKPLREQKLNYQDAKALASIYADLAKQTGEFTAAALRQRFITELNRLGIVGKFPGLGKIHEDILEKSLGKSAGKVEPAHASAVFLAMAWATWEAGK